MAKQKQETDLGLTESELLVHKVAFLSTKGLTQSAIGEKVGILDRTKISRLLSKASRDDLIRTEYTPRDMGVYEYVTRFFGSVNLDEVLEEFADLEGFDKSYLPKTQTIVTHLATDSGDDLQKRMDTFGTQCGPVTISLMRDLCKANAKQKGSTPPLVGVCSGRTLRSVVEPLRLEKMQGDVDELEAIPCWGSAYSGQVGSWHCGVYSDSHQLSATAIANDILKALRRDDSATTKYSLAGVPIALPTRYKGDKLATLKDFFNSVSSLPTIFEGSNALVKNVGMLMVSAGPPRHKERKFFSDSILHSLMPESDANELLKNIIGDVAGILIPRPNKRSIALLKKLVKEDHWLGLRAKHLSSIAKAARDSVILPGVCAYVAGAHRSEIVLESIRLGYFNHLICDSSLAEQIAKDVKRLKRAGGS